MAEDSRCPSCSVPEWELWSEYVWNRPDVEVRRCAACSLVYLHPMMTEDEEHTFYANYDKHIQARGMKGGDDSAILFQTTTPEAVDRVQLIRRYLNPNMSVLEIGASTGAFLQAIRGEVAEVAGVEPSHVHAEHMAKLGVRTVEHLEDLEADDVFDAGALFHVLEHMRSPVRFLQEISARLKPNGYVFIEVPNIQEALLSLYSCVPFTQFYYQPMHCLYFSVDTLQEVCERAGLSTVELIPKQRYDLSNHFAWLQHGKPGGSQRFKHVFTPELEAAYASSLKSHWLCDTIFGIFQLK